MNILEQIIASKKKEVRVLKEAMPLKELTKSEFYDRRCVSLKAVLQRSGYPRIIAEFKRKSPSLGMISEQAQVEKVIPGYVEAGAAAVSVLTDYPYFGGRPEDLACARVLVPVPLLRKDFIIDEYQLHEAKSLGADLVLLIAASLTRARAARLARQAKSLGLEVLLEIHEEKELAYLNEHVDIAGINNRNLKSFHVDTGTSLELGKKVPEEFLKISESGLQLASTVADLFGAGFRGFLMGEAFMSKTSPEEACRSFIMQLNSLKTG